MEERLTVLETKVTYQDQIIEELNELIIEQQDKIDKLVLMYKQIIGQNQSNDDGLVDISLETPPPHY